MPVNIHEDHVSAVTSIDYAPTGREFVTGSYDKSIRIFEVQKVSISLILYLNFLLYPFDSNLWKFLGSFERNLPYQKNAACN